MTTSTTVDANFWQILTELQRVMRTEITFNPMGEDRCKPIDPKAIVIRKFKAPKADFVAQTNEITPGWIISPGRVVRPPMEGTNEQDDVIYRVVLQLIDVDYDDQCHGLRSHLKWLEQACKLLNHWFAAHQICNPNDCVRENVATAFDVGDEKQFIRHKNFIAGIAVDNFVWEQRGAT